MQVAGVLAPPLHGEMVGIAVVDKRTLVVLVLRLVACISEDLVVVVADAEKGILKRDHQRDAVGAYLVLLKWSFDLANFSCERHHLVDAAWVFRLRCCSHCKRAQQQYKD